MSAISTRHLRSFSHAFREKVIAAVKGLDPQARELLSQRFGLFNLPPKSLAEISEQSGKPLPGIMEAEAQALRALMGYGRRNGHLC